MIMPFSLEDRAFPVTYDTTMLWFTKFSDQCLSYRLFSSRSWQ